MEHIVPFRWNLARREQLGGLLEGEQADIPDGYLEELAETCAKVVARAGNSRLVFVGRSPEHLFDYISGIFASLDDPRDPLLLQFSASLERDRVPLDLDYFSPAEYRSFLGYLEAVSLAPLQVQSSPRPIRFVDLVSTGTTFRVVVQVVRQLAHQQGADWNIVKKRIGFVGLTLREKNSPNTYRWQQSESWLESADGVFVKNVSVSWPFYNHIGNVSAKVTRSYRRSIWASVGAEKNSPSDAMLKALRRSVQIYDMASSKDERLRFSARLAALQEFREPWLRTLVLDLKKTGRA